MSDEKKPVEKEKATKPSLMQRLKAALGKVRDSAGEAVGEAADQR